MNSINECNANERIRRRTEINTVSTNSCRKTHWSGSDKEVHALKQWPPANDLQSFPYTQQNKTNELKK